MTDKDEKDRTGRQRKKETDQTATLEKEVLTRVQHLRTLTKEISRTHLANLEHDIIHVADTLDGAEGERKSGARRTVLERVLRVLDDLSVKPEKGRRKDLRHIEEAIDEMLEIVEDRKK